MEECKHIYKSEERGYDNGVYSIALVCEKCGMEQRADFSEVEEQILKRLTLTEGTLAALPCKTCPKGHKGGANEFNEDR